MIKETNFKVFLYTLFKLNRNNLLAAHVVLMFLDINTLSHAELYKEVKYFL